MKILTGKVISTKMNKTIVVDVKSQKFDPLYKKIIYRTKKYKVHSENPEVKVGTEVKIVSTRPISKEKHYKILESSKKKS